MCCYCCYCGVFLFNRLHFAYGEASLSFYIRIFFSRYLCILFHISLVARTLFHKRRKKKSPRINSQHILWDAKWKRVSFILCSVKCTFHHSTKWLPYIYRCTTRAKTHWRYKTCRKKNYFLIFLIASVCMFLYECVCVNKIGVYVSIFELFIGLPFIVTELQWNLYDHWEFWCCWLWPFFISAVFSP